MPSRCASRCRARTIFLRLRLPVLDEPAVGLLEPLGELALVELLALAGGRARALASPRRIAGHRLEPAQLVPGQRWPPAGVVLLACEQLPEQHAELAPRGDERDLGPAPRPQALIEGAQRARRAHRDPGGLAEHVACCRGTLLRDPPVARRLIARLAHPRIEPEVADKVLRRF